MSESRVALVTGAASGIGWAVAERLQRDGFVLVFHSHGRDENARERFEELAASGPAHWVAGDIAEASAGERLVAETVAAAGRLDVLVNNAGITVSKPALELTAADFDRIFGVDVKGSFLLAVAAARRMRRMGGGVIVNVTSVHEHQPRPGFALYAGAKAALGMITRSLALELAPDGIRIVSVAPGAIRTERNEGARSDAGKIPLGRPGEPEEVAGLVSYAVGRDASYVTGASLVVDGGFLQHGVGA